MIKLVKNYSHLFLFATVLLLIDTLLAAGATLSVGPIVDFLMKSATGDQGSVTPKIVAIIESIGVSATLVNMLLTFLTLQFLKSTFTVLITHSVVKIKYQVMRDLTTATFEDIFSARWRFFSEHSQGYLMNTLVKELNKVGDAFYSISVFITKSIQLFVYLLIPILVSWQVTLIFIGIAALLFAPFYLLSKLNFRFGQKNTSTANVMTSRMLEALASAKVILGFGRHSKIISNIDEAYSAHGVAATRVYTLNALLTEVGMPLGITALLLSFYLAPSGTVAVADLAIIVWSLRYASTIVGTVLNTKGAIESFKPSFRQLEDIRHKAQDYKVPTGQKPFTNLLSEISAHHLSFAYNEDQPILKNLSFQIGKGEFIAFAGPSGAGKSTLVDLLTGFHTATSGEVRYDSDNLDTLDLISVRQKIGYVPQDPILFNTSIRENLLWAHPSASEESIQHALELSNAHEFVRKLPDGLDTQIGDRGSNLSGGQRQRIALARALVVQPELLVLDEATSALDSHSEKKIQETIENLQGKLTIIAIAHRSSTFRVADRVFLIENGEISAQGKLSDLERTTSFFRAPESAV